MKINSRSSLAVIAGIVTTAISIIPAIAEDSTAATAQEMSYGVSDVLQLSKAKVGEDTIVSYVQNSGNTYGGMSASEIVYLHQQGVSDRVVNTMLEQRARITAAAQAQTASAMVNAISGSGTANVQPVNELPTIITYVRPAPVSTVYVMRDSSPRLVDYGIYPRYPYYGGYYYGCAPRVSFSFGFGGGYHRTFYRSGGFYGGSHHGGSVYHGGFHGHH